MIYSTYTFGGIELIKVDNNSDIIISDNITNQLTSNTSNFINTEGFRILAKLDSEANLIWSQKYIGKNITPNNLEINDIVIDNKNNIIVGGAVSFLGGTRVTELGVSTNNGYSKTFDFGDYTSENWAGFIKKYSTNGIEQFGTFIGDNRQTFVNSLAIGNNNSIIVGGNSNSTEKITGFNKQLFMSNHKRLSDINVDGLGLIMKFNETGSVNWSFLYGDYSYRSRFYGIDYNLATNEIIVVGDNRSPYLIATPNGNQIIPSEFSNDTNANGTIVLFEDIDNQFDLNINGNFCELKDIKYTASGADSYEWTDIKGNKFPDNTFRNEFNPPYYGEFICKYTKGDKVGYISFMVLDNKPKEIQPFEKFLCDYYQAGEIFYDLNNLKPEISNERNNIIKFYEEESLTNEIVAPIKVDNSTRVYFTYQNEFSCIVKSHIDFKLGKFNLIDNFEYKYCRVESENVIINLNDLKFDLSNQYSVNSNELLVYENFEDATLQNNNDIKNLDKYHKPNNIKELYFSLKSNDQCKTIYKVRLSEQTLPNINIKESYYKCINESLIINLEGDLESIVWSNGQKGNKATFNEVGKYSVTITNDKCSITKTFEIKEFPSLNFEYNYDGNSVTFRFLNDYNAKVSLDQKNWNTVFDLPTGYYTFYIKSSNGCLEVHEIYLYKDLPSVITPNGDGKNDFWDISYLKNLESVTIFNRKGMKLFFKQKADQPIKWDGKLNGTNLPTDTYWYKIKLDDDSIINGSILLKNK